MRSRSYTRAASGAVFTLLLGLIQITVLAQPAEAQAEGASPYAMQTADDAGLEGAPLGRAAEVLDAYMDALSHEDYSAASKMLVETPALTAGNVKRYMMAFTKVARSDPRLLAEHVIDDCAVVMFADSRPVAPQAAYLFRQDGQWKISPWVTQWTNITEVLDAQQKARFGELEDWESQFHDNPELAIRNATPDLGPAVAPQQQTAVMPDAAGNPQAAEAVGLPEGSAGPTGVAETYLAITWSSEPAPARQMIAEPMAKIGTDPEWFFATTPQRLSRGSHARAEHVVGDWAVVLFTTPYQGHEVRSVVYLIRQNGGWKLYPTNLRGALRPQPRVPVSDEVKTTLESLAAWVENHP